MIGAKELGGDILDARMKQFISRVRNRIRKQCMIDNLIKFIEGGMLIAVILSLVALVVPFYYAIIMAVSVFIASFFMGIIWGVKMTPDLMKVALLIDAKGYQEKISTAFYLQGKEDVFSLMQKKDAMGIVARFHIEKEFPIRIEWKRVGILLLSIVVFVISSLLDTPAKQEAVARYDVKKEAKEQIEYLEKLEQELNEKVELEKEDVVRIKEEIESVEEELKTVESYEELEKVKAQTNQRMEMARKEVKDPAVKKMLEKTMQDMVASEENKEELQDEKKTTNNKSNEDYATADANTQNNNQSDSQNNGSRSKGNGTQGDTEKNGGGQGRHIAGDEDSDNDDVSNIDYGNSYENDSLKNSEEDSTTSSDESNGDDKTRMDDDSNQEPNQEQIWSGDKVNYGEVSGAYKKEAYKKVNGSTYPSKLKDKIKNYFDGLN